MKRVLIIDDEPAFTELIRLQLESHGGFEVHTETHSSHAIRTAREFSPYIILLDIMMPEIEGSELAAQFLEQPDLRDTPIIFLSALITSQEVRSFDHGSRMYLPKTTSIEDLVKAIEQSLETLSARGARLAEMA
jgi:CheY-like chemotaxis protein